MNFVQNGSIHLCYGCHVVHGRLRSAGLGLMTGIHNGLLCYVEVTMCRISRAFQAMKWATVMEIALLIDLFAFQMVRS